MNFETENVVSSSLCSFLKKNLSKDQFYQNHCKVIVSTCMELRLFMKNSFSLSNEGENENLKPVK